MVLEEIFILMACWNGLKSTEMKWGKEFKEVMQKAY